MEGLLNSSVLPLVMMFLVVYLFMIRPQMKRAKQTKQFNNELKVGDRVVMESGLHGKIMHLNDDGTCVIETSAGKLKYERSKISLELSQRLHAKKEK